jgi:uncharacterized protein YdaU (DUF1376 family)
MTIENGGPPIDDDANPKLRWVKLNVTEVLEGIEELSWEQRGYYLTALFKMYARMGGLPADDYEGAKAMRCDVRFFRRLRDQIIASGKFYVEDGLLKNSRVEREITDYVREFKKRRDAALAREEKKRVAAVELRSTSGELRGDFGETSGRSSGEVSQTSFELEPKKATKSKDAAPQHYQKMTTNQNQEPEPRKEREEICAVDTAPSTSAFEEFWKAFPTGRKKGKGAARDLFAKIVSRRHRTLRAKPEAIVEAAKRYAATNPDPQYVPLPTTWLNEGRWEDEIAHADPSPVNGKSWGWWRGLEPKLKALPLERWRKAIQDAKPNGTWPWWILGAPPGDPECLLPAEIISENNYVEIYGGKITHG